MLTAEERERFTDIQDQLLSLYFARREAEKSRDAGQTRYLQSEIERAEAEHAQLRPWNAAGPA